MYALTSPSENESNCFPALPSRRFYGLAVTGSFDALSDYFAFKRSAIYVAVFVLCRREPGLARPYRTFGCPAVPAPYAVVGAWLVVQTALSSPGESLIGLAIVAVSFPVVPAPGRRSR